LRSTYQLSIKTSKRFSATSSDPLISVKDAFEGSQKRRTVFIDVRDPNDFTQGHIPQAQSINEIFSFLSTSDAQGKREMLNTFEKLFQNAGINGNEHVITYEHSLNTRFGASCRGYYILKLLGHSNVNVLNGGFEAWRLANYPTSNVPTVATPGTFQANWNNDIYVDKDQMLDIVQKKDTVIIDVRDEEEWLAASSSPYGKDFAPRKGRIPGAIHLMWKDLMTVQDGITVLKTPEEIESICRQKGITKDKQTVVYCFKGARSSNTYFALRRSGFNNVRNYFSSWNEWSRNHSLPIENHKL